MRQSQKTIGILGGMGPRATNYLFNLIISHTAAKSDKDHPRVLISSNSEIPDRTAHLLNNGPSPLPILIKEARGLQTAGADFIVMPCITAHHYHSMILPHIRIPFFNLIQESIQHIFSSYPELSVMGLLATSGTIQAEIFQPIEADHLLQFITPGQEKQKQVMEAIYGDKGIKAGYYEEPSGILSDVISWLINNGAQGIIIGCTEISLALSSRQFEIPVIDPLKVITRKIILEAGCTPIF